VATVARDGVRIVTVDVVAARVSPPPEQAALRALKGEWVFVVVRGENGLSGVGEATHGGDDVHLAHLVRARLGPQLAGVHVSATGQGGSTPDALVRRWFAEASVAGRVMATAASAIEQALWDLAARTQQVPVYRALGAPPRSPNSSIDLYATLNRGIFDRSPDGFAQAARRAVQEGFRAVKCAPFDGVAHGGAQDLAERMALIDTGIERVAAVREAIGPGAWLMVDCHGRFLEAEAPLVSRRLAPYRLRWLEEPVPFDPDPLPLARVRQQIDIPIAAGELMFGADRFRPLLEAGAVDVLMPDVKHCGGLSEGKRIAELAAQHGVEIAPHNPSGPISTLASAHLCASLANATLLEFAWGEVAWRRALLSPPEPVRAGRLYLPDAPGFGAALDSRTLQEHDYPL
jgi:galactonate dehydratase